MAACTLVGVAALVLLLGVRPLADSIPKGQGATANYLLVFDGERDYERLGLTSRWGDHTFKDRREN